MFKWKTYKFGTISNNEELLTDMLAGMAGKNRVIKKIACSIDADINLRAYRDGEQIVDIACDLLTAYAPFLSVDIPLSEGQLCKVGFYNSAAGDVTPTISIGYEEAG